jgi:hypothetical protein
MAVAPSIEPISATAQTMALAQVRTTPMAPTRCRQARILLGGMTAARIGARAV